MVKVQYSGNMPVKKTRIDECGFHNTISWGPIHHSIIHEMYITQIGSDGIWSDKVLFLECYFGIGSIILS